MGSCATKAPMKTFAVIGLHGAGKTHFLDMFDVGFDSTKLLTKGFYEKQIDESILLREFGGSTTYIDRAYDGLICLLDSRYGRDELLDAKNLLLTFACLKIVHVPIVIIVNQRSKTPLASLELLQLDKFANRPVMVSQIDFSKNDWRTKSFDVLEFLKEPR